MIRWNRDTGRVHGEFSPSENRSHALLAVKGARSRCDALINSTRPTVQKRDRLTLCGTRSFSYERKKRECENTAQTWDAAVGGAGDSAAARFVAEYERRETLDYPASAQLAIKVMIQ